MKLELTRKILTNNSTIGDLLVNGEFLCYTLEDVVRTGDKVPGQTAIPVGTYKVVIDFSNRFQKLMPHILDVPGFEGVRIHSGNTAENTEGCVLVGLTKDRDFVGQSKDAIKKLMPLLDKALQNKEEIKLYVS